jgi:hypothetical protein
MAHAQKPDFVFRRNGWVHLNWQGNQFSRLLTGELCTSACRVCTARASLCSAVMWPYFLPTPFASFPFTSPPVRHCMPSHFKRSLQQQLVSGKSWVFSSPPNMGLFIWPQYGLCMCLRKADVCHPIKVLPLSGMSGVRGHSSTTQHKVCVVSTLRLVTRQHNLWEANCAPDIIIIIIIY